MSWPPFWDFSSAEGDLTQLIKVNQTDEIGSLVKSINYMAKNLHGMIQKNKEGLHTLTSSATELAAVSDQITGGSENTALKSDGVAAAAEEMSTSMTSVAAATEQATTNIQMIASAVEEMNVTIQEISKNMSQGGGCIKPCSDHS